MTLNKFYLKAETLLSKIDPQIIWRKFWMVTIFLNIYFMEGVCQLVSAEVPVTTDDLTLVQRVSIKGPLTMKVIDFTFQTVSAVLSSDDCGTYCRITFVPPNSELKLEDGRRVGQIILIEGSHSDEPWVIFDNPSPGGNVDLRIGRVLSKGDIIQLIWNGDNWIELGFGNN